MGEHQKGGRSKGPGGGYGKSGGLAALLGAAAGAVEGLRTLL